MLFNQDTILNTDVRRFDTSWKFEWKFDEPDNDGTIKLNSIIYDKNKNDQWYFDANVQEFKTTDHYLNAQWPLEPTKTKYLGARNTFISVKSETKEIYIDPKPPVFTYDYNTDYIALSPTYTINSNGKIELLNSIDRHCEFVFTDDSGVDFSQFIIELEATEGDKQKQLILYKFIRHNTLLNDDDKDILKYETNYIKNVSLKYDGNNNYLLSFDLTEFLQDYPKKWSIKYNEDNDKETTNKKPSIEYLNDISKTKYDEKTGYPTTDLQGRLKITIFDLAGNQTVLQNKKEFSTIDINDLNTLKPVEIEYTNITPQNYLISNDIIGETIVYINNPIYALWKYNIKCELTDNSIGIIDTSSISYDKKTGSTTLKITNVNKHGNIDLMAWVETSNKKINELIKPRTINSKICGPWIFEGNGRKYNINQYVPKYLRDTNFGEFIDFFQTYLNTMYLSLNNEENISALEKISRINNFNDINLIENELINHYENQFGNELPFDLVSMKNLNTVFTNGNFGTVTDEEIHHIIKYVLEQLPYYNQYKGTNLGMSFALKMFGFCCNIISLWCKTNEEIQQNPNFIEEDRLLDYNNLFMTNRFNIEINTNNTFKILNDNINHFIKIIQHIKPITHILNMIKYAVYKNYENSLLISSKCYDVNNPITYELTWCITKELANKINKTIIVNENQYTCNNLCLPYNPRVMINNNDTNIKNVYTILAKLFEYTNFDIILTCINENKKETITYTIPENSYSVSLNPGLFSINDLEQCGATLYNIFDKFLNVKNTNETTITMKIQDYPGTNYIKCES